MGGEVRLWIMRWTFIKIILNRDRISIDRAPLSLCQWSWRKIIVTIIVAKSYIVTDWREYWTWSEGTNREDVVHLLCYEWADRVVHCTIWISSSMSTCQACKFDFDLTASPSGNKEVVCPCWLGNKHVTTRRRLSWAGQLINLLLAQQG